MNEGAVKDLFHPSKGQVPCGYGLLRRCQTALPRDPLVKSLAVEQNVHDPINIFVRSYAGKNTVDSKPPAIGPADLNSSGTSRKHLLHLCRLGLLS